MTVNDDARGVNTEDVSASVLSTLKAGLGLLGKHPLRQSHTYLSLSVPRSGLDDASVGSLSSYPNIMYLDVSGNKIGDLSVLGQLPTLVQLDASWNEVGECLAFAPPRCSRTQAWSDGDLAVGSMLTLANLSHNRINALRDLSAHAFLETLLLGYNSIVQIEGLQNLKFLQVLDLSYNKIAAISGLDGLRLQELNLEGNELSSLEGLGGLPSLSVLNVARNKLESLQPLQSCQSLLTLDAGHNAVSVLRQVEFLRPLPWLANLTLMGNPGARKAHYRLRVLFKLPNLKRLDTSNASAEEQVRACNLFRSQGGDLEARAAVHAKYFPGEPFEDFGPTAFWEDDEEGGEMTAEPTAAAEAAAAEAAAETGAEAGAGAGADAGAGAGAAEAEAAPQHYPFREGERVEGNYRGHHLWYPGVVGRVHGDGTFDLNYDDGETEAHVGGALVRYRPSTPELAELPLPVNLVEGEKVEANYRGHGKWYPGTVVAIHEDGSVNIDYDDGEKEARVPVSCIRAVGLGIAADPILAHALHEYAEEALLEAQ